MDENEEKLEEIKRAFTRRIEDVRTLPDMVNFIKNISPVKVKSFIKIQLQQDVDNADNSITHIEDRITFKQNLITEIDSIRIATVSSELDGR